MHPILNIDCVYSFIESQPIRSDKFLKQDIEKHTYGCCNEDDLQE